MRLAAQGISAASLLQGAPSAMERYLNLSGNSGVAAYKIARDAITVEFGDGGTYLYTKQSAGHANIEQMKVLARTGKGLSTFIVNNVREKYAAKLC